MHTGGDPNLLLGIKRPRHSIEDSFRHIKLKIRVDIGNIRHFSFSRQGLVSGSIDQHDLQKVVNAVGCAVQQ